MLLLSPKFLLRQGLAVRGHDEIEGNLMQLLLLLRCEDNSNLKMWIKEKKYLSSDIINEIMQIMSSSILKQLREASMYSLIVDEAMDISKRNKCACVSGGLIRILKFMKTQ